jgi:hypothetical protein
VRKIGKVRPGVVGWEFWDAWVEQAKTPKVLGEKTSLNQDTKKLWE